MRLDPPVGSCGIGLTRGSTPLSIPRKAHPRTVDPHAGPSSSRTGGGPGTSVHRCDMLARGSGRIGAHARHPGACLDPLRGRFRTSPLGVDPPPADPLRVVRVERGPRRGRLRESRRFGLRAPRGSTPAPKRTLTLRLRIPPRARWTSKAILCGITGKEADPGNHNQQPECWDEQHQRPPTSSAQVVETLHAKGNVPRVHAANVERAARSTAFCALVHVLTALQTPPRRHGWDSWIGGEPGGRTSSCCHSRSQRAFEITR